MSDPDKASSAEGKRREFKLFLFIVVLLFPILAVALIGSYGFGVWMYQMVVGPPGPPV